MTRCVLVAAMQVGEAAFVVANTLDRAIAAAGLDTWTTTLVVAPVLDGAGLGGGATDRRMTGRQASGALTVRLLSGFVSERYGESQRISHQGEYTLHIDVGGLNPKLESAASAISIIEVRRAAARADSPYLGVDRHRLPRARRAPNQRLGRHSGAAELGVVVSNLREAADVEHEEILDRSEVTRAVVVEDEANPQRTGGRDSGYEIVGLLVRAAAAVGQIETLEALSGRILVDQLSSEMSVSLPVPVPSTIVNFEFYKRRRLGRRWVFRMSVRFGRCRCRGPTPSAVPS
jgi:hypothetical protein